MSNENEEKETAGSFADEVDAAIDNLQVGGSGGLADSDAFGAADTDAEDIAARGYDKEPDHYVDFMQTVNDNALDYVPDPDADSSTVFPGAIPEMSEGQQYYADVQVGEYDDSMKAIKAKPGFDMFSAGFGVCISMLQDFIDQHKGDEDAIAIIFNNHLNDSPVTKFMVDTVEWANKQDVSDGALQPIEYLVATDTATEAGLEPAAGEFSTNLENVEYSSREAAETEKKQIDLAGEHPKEPAGREEMTDDVPSLQKTIREQQAQIEGLTQAHQRDNLAPDLWAAIADYFNGVMADQPENFLEHPLILRIQMFVNRLRNESWQWQNRDNKNEPDFYELPPILADLLHGEPEQQQQGLEPGEKLVNMVARLHYESDAFKAACDVIEDDLNQQPITNKVSAFMQALRILAEDAEKYRTLQNKDVTRY